MQSTMNQMLNIFKEQKEREPGNKRPAPNINHIPITSPKRKQKLNTTPFLSSTPIEGSKIFDFETYDDEACNPLQSTQPTFTEDSADEAMMPRDTTGEGEGQ